MTYCIKTGRTGRSGFRLGQFDARTGRGRDEMKACIAAVRKTDMTNEDMLRHDLEFHNIIRRAANNDILLNICITLTGTIYDERRVLFTHTNYVEQSLWEHNQIANAFGSLDVNQVKQAYIAHLAMFSISSLWIISQRELPSSGCVSSFRRKMPLPWRISTTSIASSTFSASRRELRLMPSCSAAASRQAYTVSDASIAAGYPPRRYD